MRRQSRTRLGDGRVHDFQDLEACLLGILQAFAQRGHRDPESLNIELKRGDAGRGACDLEVHVTHAVLQPLDVCDQCLFGIALDQPDRNARDRRLDGHACVHQGKGGSADGGL